MIVKVNLLQPLNPFIKSCQESTAKNNYIEKVKFKKARRIRLFKACRKIALRNGRLTIPVESQYSRFHPVQDKIDKCAGTVPRIWKRNDLPAQQFHKPYPLFYCCSTSWLSVEISPFFFIQTIAFQQKIVLIIQFSDYLADLSSRIRKRACFHFSKRKDDDRVCSLKKPVTLLFPNGKAFKQFLSHEYCLLPYP